MSNTHPTQETALAQILTAIAALTTGSGENRSALDSLPQELGRQRILPTKQTLAFVGSSPANWRRLQRLNLAPAPIQIGLRKLGWRLGDLIDYLESRSQKAPIDEPRAPDRQRPARALDEPRHVLTREPIAP